ncbi:ASCH domain-containing protein [Mycetocola zhadangensis]|uniref:ASCH domain-containing protein n=1 Tax=Mycetocola zhadangensis TaxID=1164595 RepID=UPI003A4DEE05
MSDERHPLPALDRRAADAMWADYARASPATVRASAEYTVEAFGDSVELADALLAEVLHGSKRATAELVDAHIADGDALPRVGSHWVVCDGTGAPRLILRSIELRIGTFSSVDAQFAYDEGEDDRTLESWQREHRRYWQRTCAARGTVFSEESDEIMLERFRVVWPPEHAD